MPSPEWYRRWTESVRGLDERLVGIHLPVGEHPATGSFNIMAYWFDHIVHHHGIEPIVKNEEKDIWEFNTTPDGHYMGSMSAGRMEEWHDEYYGEHTHGYKTLLLGVW